MAARHPLLPAGTARLRALQVRAVRLSWRHPKPGGLVPSQLRARRHPRPGGLVPSLLPSAWPGGSGAAEQWTTSSPTSPRAGLDNHLTKAVPSITSPTPSSRITKITKRPLGALSRGWTTMATEPQRRPVPALRAQGGRGGLAHVSGGVAVSTRTKNTFVDVGGPSAACQRRTLRRNATDGDDPMQQDPATRVSAGASSSSGPPVAQALVVVTPPPTGSDVSGWASGMSNSAGPQRHEGTQPEAPHPSPPAATPIMHRCPLTGCPAADAARSRGWRSLAA